MFYCISVESDEAADQTKPAGLLQDHSTHSQECTHGRRPWLVLIQTGSWWLFYITLDTLTSLLPFDWYFLCSAVWIRHWIRLLPEWVVCHRWNLWCLFTNFFSSRSENVAAGCSKTGITSGTVSFPQQFAPFPGGRGPQQLPQDQNKEIPPNSLPDARLGGTPFPLHAPYAFIFCTFFNLLFLFLARICEKYLDH